MATLAMPNTSAYGTYLVTRLNGSGVGEDSYVSIKLPGSSGLEALIYQGHTFADLQASIQNAGNLCKEYLVQQWAKYCTAAKQHRLG
jgi:hypothetical protein